MADFIEERVMMAPGTIAIIISFVSLCFAIWMGLKGDKRTDTKDIEERARENAKINFKLDEISGTTREIKQDITSVRDEIKSHNDRLIKVEESAKQAHKRIDLLDKTLIRKGDE